MEQNKFENMPQFEIKVSAKRPLSCEVCGDVGSGFSYGAYSCFGCKKFFFRSVRRKQGVNCPKSGTCEITRETRNHCKACRYRACLEAGMRDLKHKSKDEDVSSPPSKKFKNTETKISTGKDVVKVLSEAMEATYKTADIVCEKTVKKMTEIDDIGGQGRLSVTQFIERILGCNEEQYKQMSFLEVAVSDILALRLASRFVPEVKGFLFHCGSLIPVAEMAMSLGRSKCCRLIYVASLLIFMAVNDQELSLLCGILATVCRPEQAESSPKLLDTLRSYLITLHHHELGKRSWMSNTSYKMLQALWNVQDISLTVKIATDSVLKKVNDNLPGVDTYSSPSLEAANILAIELFQGLFDYSEVLPKCDVLERKASDSPCYLDAPPSPKLSNPPDEVAPVSVTQGVNVTLSTNDIIDGNHKFSPVQLNSKEDRQNMPLSNNELSHLYPHLLVSKNIETVTHHSNSSLVHNVNIHSQFIPSYETLLHSVPYSLNEKQLSIQNKYQDFPQNEYLSFPAVEQVGICAKKGFKEENSMTVVDAENAFTSFMIGQDRSCL